MKKLVLIIICLICCFAVSCSDNEHAKPYDLTLDNLGTVIQLITMFVAVVLLKEGLKELPLLGTMYFEAFGLTVVAKEALKYIFPRSRPYTCFDSAPIQEMNDWTKSFPSGHTAYAFAAATFTVYVFCKYNSNSKAKIPLIVVSYALACATGNLRVVCGSHFTTDVVAGALLGSAIGFAVPYVHHLVAKKRNKSDKAPFSFLIK